MGLFDGIEKAEIFERGRYFPPDFRGVVEVKKTIAKDSIKSGLGFIVELEVVEVERPGKADHELSPVTVGEKRTWWQGMKDKTVAFPSIKEFVAALSGFERHEKKAIEESVSPVLSGVLDHATENPDANDLVGCRLRLETSHKLTKNKSDFTIHTWGPYTEEASPEA